MSLVSISDLNGPQQHVVELINVAKQRGGQDNITCILLLALPA